jgi:DNA-directed RNA polymerase subunit RPC12/RpoP
MVEPVDDDWWKHGPARHEFDDDELDGDEDEDPIAECPQCGAEIFDDANQCPACGSWIVPDSRAMTGKITWFMVLGFVGVIVAILGWILYR